MRKTLTKEIERVFKQASPASEYKVGFLAYITEEQHDLPLIWACPLELEASTGRKEGKRTYSAKIYLLSENKSYTHIEKEDIWQEQEQVALSACSRLVYSEELEVIAVDNVKCSPDEMPLTGYDTISMTVTFNVTSLYCEQ